ncbi:hypothetical protein L218DRAFT_947444 [Marasmius fiardii PR-910]|nr:hypothetical protein L218DRAFT_947444 [Marasmius fiardii PR-910]
MSNLPCLAVESPERRSSSQTRIKSSTIRPATRHAGTPSFSLPSRVAVIVTTERIMWIDLRMQDDPTEQEYLPEPNGTSSELYGSPELRNAKQDSSLSNLYGAYIDLCPRIREFEYSDEWLADARLAEKDGRNIKRSDGSAPRAWSSFSRFLEGDTRVGRLAYEPGTGMRSTMC